MKKQLTLLALTCVTSVMFAQTQQTVDTVQIFSRAHKKDAQTFSNINLGKRDISVSKQEPAFIISNLTPGVTAYSDSGSESGYSYYRIRGIDQTRINTMFDGAPMNEPEDQGAYFSNYPDLFSSLDNIQIQRGVGLSRNGTASYGGSVQLFSPNLKERKGEIGLSIGSYNTGRINGKFSTGLNAKNQGLLVGLSEQYSDGYKEHSWNHGQSLFLTAVDYNPRSTWKFTNFTGNQRNNQAWIGTTVEQIRENPRANGNTDREKDHFFQSFSQVLNSTQLGSRTELQSSVYYTYLRGNYDFDLNNFLGIPEQGELYNYALESNLIGAYSTLKHNYQNVVISTFGINANIYQRSHTGSEKTQNVNLYRNTGRKNDFSVFGQTQIKLLSNVKLMLDLQYRHAEFMYSGSQSFKNQTWDFWNPKVGLTYTVSPKSELYASFGSVGREPTRTDMFAGSDDYDPTLVGITEPEYLVDYELGYRFTNQYLKLDLNAFLMSFSDEIVLKGAYGSNSLSLTQSVPKSFRSGLEFSGRYSRNNWELQHTSSWMYTEIQSGEGAKFRHILTPDFIINTNLTRVLGNFRVGLGSRFQSESWIDFENETAIPSYFLLNAMTSYTSSKYEIGLNVQNLTNCRYYNNAYVQDSTIRYFVQMPLNVMLNFKYKF